MNTTTICVTSPRLQSILLSGAAALEAEMVKRW
jgi:hypothetical protein